MNRYQIYLNPDSVETYDSLAQIIGLSRSQIIRDVADRVAREYMKLIMAARPADIRKNPLLMMAGFAKSPTGHVSESIDEIYLKD